MQHAQRRGCPPAARQQREVQQQGRRWVGAARGGCCIRRRLHLLHGNIQQLLQLGCSAGQCGAWQSCIAIIAGSRSKARGLSRA